jgi:hypothetical protein
MDQPIGNDIVVTLQALKEEFALELESRVGKRSTELRMRSKAERTPKTAREPLTDGYHCLHFHLPSSQRPKGDEFVFQLFGRTIGRSQ